ncbi:MAG: aminotransferase class I/II-fold pyridoxal phosphate-dependent enzyme, partial [Crocinitomicaceae bacterium]|nr:aminotransferase class I/II-fold pyridoxal phosphate-dependent enzyme [Crocinitomicaceae bacterium]
IKSNGITIQMIRHNRMDMLEDRIKKLRTTHDKIWYMADGIYSMYGDKAPLDDIYALMDKYPELHLYIDDAHGMSCYGPNGEGYVMSHSPLNDRTIVTLSLAKGFGSGGAVFVFPTAEMARRVQYTGLPMITGGPIQPSVLGASIESTKIHLSNEFEDIQDELKENIKYTNILLNKYNLPLIDRNDTPIFFIGAGLPKTGRNITDRMMNEGIYQNLGIFPAVPIKNTGIRFTITKLHTFEQIEHMVEKMAHHFPLALEEEGVSMDQIRRNFNLPSEETNISNSISSVVEYSKLKVETYGSISSLDSKEWDSLFSFNKQLNHDQFQIQERVYKENSSQEYNWDFNYTYIKSPDNKIVIAAPLVTWLQKDDILHPEAISESIEQQRKHNPYYLTSRVLSTGSPLTLGKSVYVDASSPYIQEAINKFTQELHRIQKETDAKSIMIRDFDESDDNLFHKKFQEAGFFKLNTCTTNTIDHLPKNMDEYLNSLSKNSRRHIKRKVDRISDEYQYSAISNPSFPKIEEWYQLYLNVSERKKEINVFAMPFSLFRNIISSSSWEVHELRKKDTVDAVGVLFIHKDEQDKILTPNFIGLSNKHIGKNIYPQLMFNIAQYAIENDYLQLNLGATAEFEKSRIGAKTKQLHAYYQVDDHYTHSQMETVHGGQKSTVFIE